jgi:hypothetical protein
MPNTDNKGKLLVTFFAFLPAGRQVLMHPRQIRNVRCTRTRTSACNQNPVPRLISGSETICTATLHQCPFTNFQVSGLIPGHLSTLYRDTRNAQ